VNEKLDKLKKKIVRNVQKYFELLNEANNNNIELYNRKYKDDPNYRLWEDSTGFSHIIKKPSCVICQYRNDIWIDPITTEVYHCGCDIGMDVKKCKTCEMFEEVIE
jgi:hypothetical protein